MHLTGPASGPPSVAPAGIVRPLAALGEALASATRALGREVTVDAVALTAQRAAFTGFGRNGPVSVGGHAQMIRAADGWVALNLPRPSDVAALPALVGTGAAGAGWSGSGRRLGARASDPAGREPVASGDWSGIEQRLALMRSAEVVETASLLGLAAAGAGDTAAPASPWSIGNDGPGRPRGRSPVVVDLTSLWAGPLAGALLAAAGARVIKVESVARPDGARRGPAGFFALLNGAKEQASLRLPEPGTVARLRGLIAGADLVLEASRPRVMQQWGISPEEAVEAGTAWVSVTGHGRWGSGRNRVAFGDDAAVSGGLVVAGDPPLFVGDAIADPIAGLAAAAAAAQLLAEGRAALVDVSLAAVSAWSAGRAGDAIERPVTRTGSGWAVELSGGLAAVRPSAVADTTGCHLGGGPGNDLPVGFGASR